MRCADPFASFIQGHGYNTSKVHSVANRNNTGKAKRNPRASVGQRSAKNIQQARQRVNPGNTGRYQNTGEQARQDYNNLGLCRVAIARTYALQYSAERKRKSMVYVGCVISAISCVCRQCNGWEL